MAERTIYYVTEDDYRPLRRRCRFLLRTESRAEAEACQAEDSRRRSLTAARPDSPAHPMARSEVACAAADTPSGRLWVAWLALCDAISRRYWGARAGWAQRAIRS